MDVALSTVLIVLGIIPGIVFWNTYLSGRFARQLFGASTVSELAGYVILALPLDAVALHVLGVDPRVLSLITALRTVRANPAETSQLVASLTGGGWFAVKAYLMLVALSGVMGALLRRVVWVLRFDVWVPFLRMKQAWYYTLQGRLHGLPRVVLAYADILVDHPGEGSRLYRGLVSAFEATDEGEIKELVLQDAQRGKGRGAAFTWAPIPGSRFVLVGPRIHSINMRYVRVEDKLPEGWRPRLMHKAKALLRSFVLEEP